MWYMKSKVNVINFFDDFLTDTENAEIFNWANEIPEYEDAKIHNKNEGTVNHNIRNTNIKWITPNDKNQTLFQKITSYITYLNDNNYNFDLSFIEALQFGKYQSENKQFYGLHADCGWDLIQRKLSIIIFLNDTVEFTGGELVLMTDSGSYANIEHKKNRIVVFPSFLSHQVKPVLSGVRYSLVTWVNGPRFR